MSVIRSGFLFILMVAFGLGGVFVQPASAQKILERFKTPLPDVQFMSDSDFKAATTLYEDTPYDDPILSYQIRLPNNWKQEQVVDIGIGGGKKTEEEKQDYAFSSHILGEVVRFDGPPRLGERSRFTIQALNLEYEISATQWFLQYVLSNGYTLEGLKIHSKKKVEAQYVMVERNVSYSVRSVAQINGRRMVLAQYFVPYEHWEEDKVMQAQSIDSFKLNNIKDVLIEDLLSFQFLDISEFRFPVSWELRAPTLRSIDRMHANLMNKGTNGSLDGQININLVSHFISESLKAEIRAYKKQMEERGMVFDSLIEKREDFDLDVMIDFALTEVYAVSDTDSSLVDYELWFTVMSAGGYYYFVTLLTPSRDEDFFTWGRNMEVYRLVLETLTPQEDTIAVE